MDAQLHDQITRRSNTGNISPDILLIDIDEHSLSELGPWPWPRELMAQLVRKLRESGVRAQLWDVFLSDRSVGDEVLNAALHAPVKAGSAMDVVFGQVLILDPQVQSPPRQGQLLASPNAPSLCSSVAPVRGYLGLSSTLTGVKAGHITATPDVDGGLRRLPAVVCEGERKYEQLTLAAAELLQPQASWQLQNGNALGPVQWLQRGKLRFALDANGQLIVPYRQTHTQWPAISALHVLDGSTNLGVLKDKVVLVGATAVGLADIAATPFHPNAPGVSVHAELMSAAISGNWIVTPASPQMVTLLLTTILSLLILNTAKRVKRTLLLIPLAVVAISAPLLLAVAARSHDYMLPIAAPTLGMVTLAFAFAIFSIEAERRQARILTHHLESFLPRNLAREIARQTPSGESLGKPGNGVVMALRVVGLERWSAKVDSFQALGLMHAIATLAEKHASQHGGMLEHVQGDTLLMVWPEALAEDVQKAVRTGRGLLTDLGELLIDNESESHPLGLRLTIETGPYLLAVAGSRSSRRTRILGAAVDAALAMLPLCDELASPMLLGQHAADLSPRVAVHHMGKFWLTDADQPRSIYRVAI